MASINWLSSSSFGFQAPYNLRITFRSEIQDATNQAAELMRSLGIDICNMKRSLRTSLLKRVHSSTERLQRAIDMHSYLLTAHCDPPDNSFKPLPKLSHALSSTMDDLPYQLMILTAQALKRAQINQHKTCSQGLSRLHKPSPTMRWWGNQ